MKDHAVQETIQNHKPSPIAGIDVVRFLAASLVVLWHFGGKPFIDPQGATLRVLLPAIQPGFPAGGQFSWFGWIGVQIFFVISGTVITYSAQKATPTSFFIGRLSRLWPAMILCASLCGALAVAFWGVAPRAELVRFFGSITFSPVGPWFGNQVWTLPVEIVFYLLVWLLIAGRQIANLPWLAVGLAVYSAGFWLLASLYAPALRDAHMALLTLMEHGCYFALGMILASTAIAGFRLRDGVAALVCVAAGWTEISYRAQVEVGSHIGAISTVHVTPLVPFGLWLACVIAIWLSIRWREPIALRLGAGMGFSRRLGAMTYPLYLVHYHTGGLVFAYALRRGIGLWPAFLLAYVTACLIAFVIAEWLEKPLARAVSLLTSTALGVDRRRPAARP